ncbi:hypothetical protein [Streptomyces sp. NPDC002328]|uniref:hypothetical protein n=1 Tax=Streptomyces sp. NPDC002328 TaxID=3364642 RepID=UPI0036CD07A6
MEHFVVDECGVPRWTWRCRPPGGHGDAFTHAVDLKASVSDHRFLYDPYGFVRDDHADRPTARKTVTRRGNWLRGTVLGEKLWNVLAEAPSNGSGVARLVLRADEPEWEIARYPLCLAADDKGSLVDRGLTLVIEPTTAGDRTAARLSPGKIREQAGRPVHLIGAFHHPGGEDAVDLRAERSGVVSTLRDIGRDGQADFTTQALSHRLTHPELAELLEQANRPNGGPDKAWQLVLHLAAPGTLGGWVADDGTGEQRALTAEALIGMLEPAGHHHRLRLAVVSGRPADPAEADLMTVFGIEAAPSPDTATVRTTAALTQAAPTTAAPAQAAPTTAAPAQAAPTTAAPAQAAPTTAALAQAAPTTAALAQAAPTTAALAQAAPTTAALAQAASTTAAPARAAETTAVPSVTAAPAPAATAAPSAADHPALAASAAQEASATSAASTAPAAPAARAASSAPAPAPADAPPPADRLAADLARLHGCAVLAFRHPIEDAAAVRILTSVYRKLLDRGLTLPRALAQAIAAHRKEITDLDAVAPVLYGAAAVDLTVHKSPRTTDRMPLPQLLPAPPDRLFGHHDAMERADAIIGPGNRRKANGVVLHGMEGIGKSTCAAELINQHADHYRRVLHHPREPWPEDPGEALEGFLEALIGRFGEIEQIYYRDRGRLPSPADLVTDQRELTRFCDLLTSYLPLNQAHNHLVYLQGIGPLLNELGDSTPARAGQPAPDPWQHPGWHKVICALTGREAVGFRLLMTSPRPVPLPNMESIPVRLLSPREAFRYARSLPHLRKLIDRAAGDPDERVLVERILHATEGHPALLGLADSAADRGADALRGLVEDGCTATADDKRVQQRLHDWAREAIGRLPADGGRRDLLFVLCRLSPVHRVLVRRTDDPRAASLLAVVWAVVRCRPLELDDVVADIDELLKHLCEENLIHLDESPERERVVVRIHPAVAQAAEAVQKAAAAAQESAAQDAGTAADRGAARWRMVDQVAADHTEGLVREAFRNRSYGRSADLQFLIPEALPYLAQVQRWDLCLEFVGGLLSRAPTGHVRDDVRRLLRTIKARVEPGSAEFALAERLLRNTESVADAPGDPRTDLRLAAVTRALYVRGLRDCGHLREAREACEQFLHGLDPGARDSPQAALVKVEWLRVLRDLGDWREVIDGVGPVFDALVAARWTTAVDRYRDHGDGEGLRKDLYALRRDCEFLLATHEAQDKPEHDRPVPRQDRARADHLTLERYVRREDPEGLPAHRHRVEGVLLGLHDDMRGPGLDRLEAQLKKGRDDAERHGDETLRAMTDCARARVLRLRADDYPEDGGAWCTIRKDGLSLEHAALRKLYKSGTPMDVGACHLRIRDDESRCPRPEIRELALFHHLFVMLVGELTHAYALKRGAALDSGQCAAMRESRASAPVTPEDLCTALRDDPTAGKASEARSLIDPATLLSGLVGPGEQGERRLRSAWRRVIDAFESDIECG